jgi:amino-acid N-acetyltransferase
VHLISRHVDGALLSELFTHTGIGTMLTPARLETLRPATIDDVGGILQLIRPLEEDGMLVRRSRERLEMEIERFIVLEHDGMLIGCAALYPFADARAGELACLAVHVDYRGSARGDTLLEGIEKAAHSLKLTRLFVLTTRTAHWFIERGFKAADVSELPTQKQALYNYQRRSKVFIKPLTQK